MHILYARVVFPHMLLTDVDEHLGRRGRDSETTSGKVANLADSEGYMQACYVSGRGAWMQYTGWAILLVLSMQSG